MARVTRFRHHAFPGPTPTWKVTFSRQDMTRLKSLYPGRKVARGPYSLLVHRNSVMWPPGQRAAAMAPALEGVLSRAARRLARRGRRR